MIIFLEHKEKTDLNRYGKDSGESIKAVISFFHFFFFSPTVLSHQTVKFQIHLWFVPGTAFSHSRITSFFM